jgi:chromosome segregation ATPase
MIYNQLCFDTDTCVYHQQSKREVAEMVALKQQLADAESGKKLEGDTAALEQQIEVLKTQVAVPDSKHKHAVAETEKKVMEADKKGNKELEELQRQLESGQAKLSQAAEEERKLKEALKNENERCQVLEKNLQVCMLSELPI